MSTSDRSAAYVPQTEHERYCGKHEKYRPMGFATEYPSVEGCRG